MFPAASHATSVGRWKLSPSAPAADTTATAAGATRPRAARWRRPARRHRHVLGLSAEDQLDATGRVELDDLRRHLVDNPDIVLPIDANLLRLEESVRALSQLADE